MEKRRTLGRFGTVLALAVIPTLGNSALGQAGIEAPIILPQVRTNPLSPHTLSFPSSKGEMGPPRLRLNFTGLLEDDSGPSSRPDRFQLFRMPTGFLSTPVGLDTDDDDSSENPTLTSPGTGQDRIQVAVGQDNPFFDFRYRGDPGGYGYYRLHAQYQLVDSNGGGLSLGLRAVTPAGLEADGVAQGRTILSPALAWYQDLGSNFVIHGYVGKNVHATSNWTDNLERSLHYGVALQQPVVDSSPIGSLHMFVEALGRQRSNPDLVDRPDTTLEMLPGLHWQVGENWWMQGGVLLPLGSSRLDTSLWQITCSWRF